jgi:glycosyltransferase involved in cell wall biosynthesis
MKSGGADYAMRMAEHMVAQGIEVHVLTGVGAQTGATKYSVKPIIKEWAWTDAFVIENVVKELQPDVVDIHFTGWVYNDNPMITFAPFLIRKAAPTAHISVHIESLGGVRRELSNPCDAAIRWCVSQLVGRDRINYEYGNLLRDSDSLVFLNERDLNELVSLVPEVRDKALLTPPPPIMPISAPLTPEQVHSIREQYGMGGREIMLAFYGYIYPGKGVETLLSAVEKLAPKANVGLVLAGGLPEEKVLQREGQPHYLEDLKSAGRAVSDRLFWTGYSPPDSDVPSKILRACDICVLPFERGVMLNNSSFSFAAMHGVPIITTKGEHTESVFVHDQNAVLLPPGNASALADEILSLANDAIKRQRLSAGSLALAHERFNWEKTVRETVAFWQRSKKSSLSIA